MDALTFLYWALAAGFLILVIFLCVMIFQIIRILKDVADVTDTVKHTADAIDENVTRIAGKAGDVMDKVMEYFVKPVGAAQFLFSKLGPIIDFVKSHSSVFGHEEEEEEYEEEEEKPKKRRSWGRKSSGKSEKSSAKGKKRRGRK